ncbi:UNVERIFIED_CONTAM: hypothetical protein RMT77_007059 [Armadillidium vulgare]
MERPLPPFLSTVVSSGFCFISNSILTFINDLLNCTSNSVHSYADDSTLHSTTHFKSAPSFASRVASRLQLSDSILADLDGISRWGHSNLVKFYSLKTQLLHISLSKTPPNFPILFDGSPVSPVNNINILGLNINNKLSWKPHITMVAKAASKKLGVLFRLREFFSSEQYSKYIRVLFALVWSTVLPFGEAPAPPLFWIGLSQAKRLINCPLLSNSLDPLSLRRDVGALSLFYRYYNGRCSRELASRTPPSLRRLRCTRGALLSHQFCVDVGNPRLARCGTSFFPATSILWNSLPSSIFPSVFNLPLFKASVCAHLRAVR